MKLKDLKHIKDVSVNYSLDNEENFIHFHGVFNCKYLKAKNSNQILAILEEQMPNEIFTLEQIEFILSISEKEVLVYLCRPHEDRPDIFIFPEGNIAFSVECFI